MNIIPVSNDKLIAALEENKVPASYADMVGRMFASDSTIILLSGYTQGDRGSWYFSCVEYNSHGEPYGDGKELSYPINIMKRFLPLPEGVSPATLDRATSEAFANPSAALGAEIGDDENPGGTAVATASNAAQVQRLAAIHRERVVMATAMKNLITNRMNEVSRAVRQMTDRSNYLRRVLRMMESYAGIYEEIVPIRDGEPADKDEPLYIIQATRYMDEEVGNIQANRFGQIGIDFSNIELFDEWIARPENINLIAPWKRCIIGFQPTRQSRIYSQDAMVQARLASYNKELYLLIRNGERLYRIFSGNLGALETLIPTTSEWERVMKDVANDSEYHRLKAKTEQMSWTQRVMLLQGLIHRTDILNPMPHDDIDLFKERDYEAGHVVLLRDYEAVTLDNGREKFREWLERINAQVVRGSRIYLSAKVRDTDAQERNTRYKHAWACETPTPGVYEVQRVESPQKGDEHHGRRLIIYFMPKSNIFDLYEYRERKARDGYTLHGNEYGPVWINYDALTIEDLRYHVGNRAERKGYLESLPLLTKLLAELTDEQRQEDEFVSHICRVEELEETAVRAAVDWWKTKNIWKRPLRRDIDKAWRMIRARAKEK